MSEPTPAPATETPPPPGPSRPRWMVVVPIIGGMILLLIAIMLILVLALRGVLFPQETSPGIPLEVIKPTPTGFTSPLPPPGCELYISSDDVQMAVSLPISLTVGDESFPVVPAAPDPVAWTYPADGSGAAAWVCGSVVNYVLGLEPVAENEALLADLRPGDEISLRLSNGLVLFFRFVERRQVTANEATVFEQFRPRLTLILEKDGGDWEIATADYVAESEQVEPPSGTLTDPGQPVRVGDAQVTVNRGHVVRSGPDLPPETMYYLVEFSVENAGAATLDAGSFVMQLQDGVGNQYLLSPAASGAGEHGPLGGEIAPGETAQGTAGYLVPETLAGPILIWTFSPQPGSPLRASVRLSYEPQAGPVPVARAEVDVTDAFLSTDGGTLIIVGEVHNTGGAPLTVELTDISLSSSAGLGNLRTAAPPLPWTVESDQTQVIELQYEKPDARTVLLTLLGYSFEIQGLQ